MTVNGKKIPVGGCYKTFEEAKNVRMAKEKEILDEFERNR
jgi:hypothetical protein